MDLKEPHFEQTSHKQLGEDRQGEAYAGNAPEVAAEPNGRKFYIESYGCQMNFSDSEVVASILQERGFRPTTDHFEADLILLNTCAIRDNAEQRIRNRLVEFNIVKRNKPEALVGVLGCMAERLKGKFIEEEKIVDMVIGPDAYRSLPDMFDEAQGGQKAVNVLLSREETYAEINPVRLNSNGVTAFVSITRGCDNMCTFCVVPFTRGRERSRDPESILNEVQELFDKGYREITLLGQNVDSYLWYGGGPKKDFKHQDEVTQQNAIDFAKLLDKVAQVSPLLRIRFSTSNPRDMSDDVLHVMAKHHNICKFIHLPVQSGNSRILEKMNRGHDRENYMARIERIRSIMPDCTLSTDMIVGFCSETEAEFQDTLSLMEWVKYDHAYMFYYSERPGTPAAKKFEDDVPLEDKKRRLAEMITLQRRLSSESNAKDIGKTFEVLVEGNSKRSDKQLSGRNTHNKMLVFDKVPGRDIKPGDYVQVKVLDSTSATLMGELVEA